MASPTTTRERMILSVVNRHTAAKARVEHQLNAQVKRILAELFAAERAELDLDGAKGKDAPSLIDKKTIYTPEAYARRMEAVERISALVERAEQAVANLVAAQNDSVTRIMEEFPAPTRSGYAGERPRKVDARQEWKRPVFEFLEQARTGAGVERAARLAAEKVEVQISDDLNAATRAGNADWMARNMGKVVGYRRVLHPELSEGGSCGLCIVASTRVYHANRLHPIHARCKCGILPIFKGPGGDPADALNAQDIKQFIGRFTGDAASARAEDLKKLRYKVVEHDELGPQFVVNRAESSRQVTRKEIELRGPMSENKHLRRRNLKREAELAAAIDKAKSGGDEDVKALLAGITAAVNAKRAKS